jgi:RHS repeat-associated protein
LELAGKILLTPMPIKHYYVASDGMGSVTAILDEDGNVLERRTYDAFGEMACMTPDGTPVAESPTGVDVGFQGQIRDEVTGLYQMGYRWYNPALGRWLSRDPIGLRGGVNELIRTGNNPLELADPFGLKEDSQENITKRSRIAEVAASNDGKHDWDKDVAKDDFRPGDNKCNKFVCDVLTAAKVQMVVILKDGKTRMCPRAGEIANIGWTPKGWRQLKKEEKPMPGDVAAYPLAGGGAGYSGHTGIVTKNGTLSAHHDGVYVDPKQFKDEPGLVYRRYIGD